MKKVAVSLLVFVLLCAIAVLVYVFRCPVLNLCPEETETASMAEDEKNDMPDDSQKDNTPTTEEKDSKKIAEFNDGNDPGDKTCTPYEYVQPDKEESPDEVVVNFYESWIANDLEYVHQHLYCDEECREKVMNFTDMCLDEFFDVDHWAIQWENERELIDIEVKSTSKTDTEAIYEILVEFREMTEGERWIKREIKGDFILHKEGNLWVTYMDDDSFGTNLAVFSNLNKIKKDHYRCLEAGMIEQEIPKEGGEFSIDDEAHPLYGLKIKYPEMPKDFTVQVGCSQSFPPSEFYDLEVSLPVRVALDLDEEDFREAELNPDHVEKTYFVPYYDIAFNDKTYTNARFDTVELYDSRMERRGSVMTLGHNSVNNVFEVRQTGLIPDMTMVVNPNKFFLKPINTDSFQVVDSDQDGIANHIEEVLDTDANSEDTDSDGYKDKDEMRNGYNPTGTGMLDVSDWAKSNYIVYAVDKPRDGSAPDSESVVPCSKIYFYDADQDSLVLVSDQANSNFTVDKNRGTILFMQRECGAVYSESDDRYMEYSLADGSIQEISDIEALSVYLNNGLLLQAGEEGFLGSGGHEVILYNPINKKSTRIHNFPGTRNCTPSSDGMKLYCLSGSYSFIFDILADKVEKELSVQTGQYLISKDERFMAYPKRDDLSFDIYIWDFEKNEETQLTNFKESGKKIIFTSMDGRAKADYFFVLAGKTAGGGWDTNYEDMKLQIFSFQDGLIKELSQDELERYINLSKNTSISPDGRQILFHEKNNNDTTVKIFNWENKGIRLIGEHKGSVDKMRWY